MPARQSCPAQQLDEVREARRQAEHELYGSMLASRRHARRQLRMIQAIERDHRHLSLCDLAALAASGALQRLADPLPLRQGDVPL